jgi:hypothetical protein
VTDVAAHAAQGQELGRVLDPLGHRDQLEALAETDDRPGQLGVVAGVAEALHERAVDLEHVDRKRCR